MTVRIEANTIIEVIKDREGLLELAQNLTRIAYDTSVLGVGLNLGVGAYGHSEQSFEIRFINEAAEGFQAPEVDEDEYADDDTEEDADDSEEAYDEEGEDIEGLSLVDILRAMGLVVLCDGTDDSDTDVEEQPPVKLEEPYVAPAEEDVTDRYSGQV